MGREAGSAPPAPYPPSPCSLPARWDPPCHMTASLTRPVVGESGGSRNPPPASWGGGEDQEGERRRPAALRGWSGEGGAPARAGSQAHLPGGRCRASEGIGVGDNVGQGFLRKWALKEGTEGHRPPEGCNLEGGQGWERRETHPSDLDPGKS